MALPVAIFFALSGFFYYKTKSGFCGIYGKYKTKSFSYISCTYRNAYYWHDVMQYALALG